jgi:hypothetical protein
MTCVITLIQEHDKGNHPWIQIVINTQEKTNTIIIIIIMGARLQGPLFKNIPESKPYTSRDGFEFG